MAELERPSEPTHSFLCTRGRSYFPLSSCPRCCSRVPGLAEPPRPFPAPCRTCNEGLAFWNRVQIPVSVDTHLWWHYLWSASTHTGLKVWERLPQAGREPEGVVVVYSASKTWFCSLFDLVIL